MTDEPLDPLAAFRLDGRVALVTGASSGLGRRFARVLDAAGIVGLELLSLADVPEYPEAPETGATFEDVAEARALAVASA